MPVALLDGIPTRYETYGSGPPLLMFSPGGFNAVVETWRDLGVYAKIKLLDHLPQHFTCIAYDRRECGGSGGRVERVTWRDYAAQGRALLAHLGHDRAHIIGGCMGVSVALAFLTAYPEATLSAILIWPVGGARYRLSAHQRVAQHLAYVAEAGLAGVVALARAEGKHFGADPRVGPWASLLRNDAAFADAYVQLDAARYATLLTGIARTNWDRDTAPGAEPEDLLRSDVPALIVPGHDPSHATSAARYLEECLARADYWDIAVADQTEANVPGRVLSFLASV